MVDESGYKKPDNITTSAGISTAKDESGEAVVKLNIPLSLIKKLWPIILALATGGGSLYASHSSVSTRVNDLEKDVLVIKTQLDNLVENLKKDK